MSAAEEPTDYERAVWSWTRHLRAGGSTPWSEWTAATPLVGPGSAADTPPVPVGWLPPGAAQLELVRRLAGHGFLDGPAFVRLTDLVLGRSGPGRGQAVQPLSWAGTDQVRRFGAPPVDPVDVPASELLRLAVGVLVELLLAHDDEPGGQREPRRRRLTRKPAFALAGAPLTTDAVRRGLAAAGLAEGGRTPRVVLLAEPLDYALAQVWSARVQRGAPVRWRGFVDRWSGRSNLPPSVDLPVLARQWAEQVGPERVHVVVATDGFDAATRATAGLLGVEVAVSTRRATGPGACRDLTPAAVDVARRVNGVLSVRVGEERHARAVGSLVALLHEPDGVGHVLTVPVAHRDWVRARAERVADELTSAGYPVHGRLEDLVPQSAGLPTGPRPADSLRVALAACIDQVRRDQGRGRERT